MTDFIKRGTNNIKEVGKFWHELATGIFDAELIKDFEMNTKMEKNFQNVVSFTR